MSRWPLGVFSSIDAGFGVQLDVAHKLGVTTIHLHAPNRELRTPQSARELLQRLGDLGIEITCVFAGFDGESYVDIPTVKRTVGLVPSETRAARTAELKEIVDFTASLKVTAVGLHLGFVPHDADDPEYSSLLHLTSDICGYCARSRQALHLETGQEPVKEKRFPTGLLRKSSVLRSRLFRWSLMTCGWLLEGIRLGGHSG